MNDPARLLWKLNRQLSNLNRSRHFSLALQLFYQIHSSHLFQPDSYSLSSSLAAASHLLDRHFGLQLHAHSLRSGLVTADIHVPNALLSLYAKLADLGSVVKVFDEMPLPDVYSWTTLLSVYAKRGCAGVALQMFDGVPERCAAMWNAMITGFASCGCDEFAFDLFREMQRGKTRPDEFSFACVLSLCCEREIVVLGKQVHSLVVKTGFVLVRVSVVNALLTMYFNCGMIGEGWDVFRESMICNEISFNSVIGGLVKWGRNLEAILVYKEMQCAGFTPSELTFVSVLNGCSSADVVGVGIQFHGQATKLGFCASVLVSNSAMSMYCCSGDLYSAMRVFEELENKDIVSWNSIITGYAQYGFDDMAVMIFHRMQWSGLGLDEFTVGSLLSCSGCAKYVEIIHCKAVRCGLSSKIQVRNALISAYSKHAMLEEAHQIFQNMSARNLITWNSIISGYLTNGVPMTGLLLFSEMQKEMRPDVYSLSLVLSTCASISALIHGKQVHARILRANLDMETALGNALITLYGKCGFLCWSHQVFDRMLDRDVISWNSILAAYAQHGRGHDVISWFNTMKRSSIEPDTVTFTIVLSACSHSGLVDEGLGIFSSMVVDFGIDPGADHFSCIVDLLGRAGHLKEAETLVSNLPYQADYHVWWALLSACRAHGNVRLGRIAAKRLLEVEPDNSTVYVLLSNIYAAAGQWEEADSVRGLMKENMLIKETGYSWM